MAWGTVTTVHPWPGPPRSTSAAISLGAGTYKTEKHPWDAPLDLPVRGAVCCSYPPVLVLLD